MKKNKQWEKPHVEVIESKKTKKAAGSSRNSKLYDCLGIGPFPAPPPPMRPDDCV